LDSKSEEGMTFDSILASGAAFDPNGNKDWCAAVMKKVEAEERDEEEEDSNSNEKDETNHDSVPKQCKATILVSKEKRPKERSEVVFVDHGKKDNTIQELMAPDLTSESFGISKLTKSTFVARGLTFIPQRKAVLRPIHIFHHHDGLVLRTVQEELHAIFSPSQSHWCELLFLVQPLMALPVCNPRGLLPNPCPLAV